MLKAGTRAGLLATGLGAAVGAYQGYDSGQPGAVSHGMATGALVGAAGITGFRAYQNISSRPGLTKAFMKTPGKGMAGIVLGGIGALALGKALSQPAYESASVASPDPGGRQTEEQYVNYKYGLSDRLAAMNVSGDLVFGLHNKRHG